MATTSNIQQENMIMKVENHKLLALNKTLTKNQEFCYLSSDEAAAQTTLSVSNGKNFSSGDYVLIGDFGDSISEIRTLTSGGSDTTIVITDATDFDHFVGTKITKIPYTKVGFYRSATLTGVKAQLGADVSIVANSLYTEYQDDTNTTGYAFFLFTDSTSDSEYSAGVIYSGNNVKSVESITSRAIQMTGVGYNSNFATKEQIFADFNEAQQEISQSKDWSFEQVVGSLTASTNQVEFDLDDLTYLPKYTYTNDAIVSVLFGTKPLDYITPEEWDDFYADKPTTTLASDTSVGAITMTLTDSTEFAESGAVYVGSDTVIYTANDEDTGILSGIPASGDGSITEVVSADSNVWQDVQPGEPTYYTVALGSIKLDLPVDDDLNNYKLKVSYFREIPNVDDYADETIIPFFRAISDYICYKIETRRKNIGLSDKYYQSFLIKLQRASSMYKSPARSYTTYYKNINHTGSSKIYETND